MKIALIGIGNVGAALALGWGKHGHTILLAVRDPSLQKAKDAARAVGAGARALSIGDAVQAAEIVVLATPWSAAQDALRAAGDLAGKVLIDATNPLKPDLSGLELGHTTSAGEQVARWAPGASVVKSFNTIGAVHMNEPMIGGERASMFLCGDDEAAKEKVGALAAELGFDPVDVGPLTQARLLEPLAMLWISMAFAQDYGPDIAFRLLRE